VAKQKIDEQISYNWLFVILAGTFMFVTGWAVWDETVTRREWKGYQERFFEIEEDLAKQEVELQQQLLDPAQCTGACTAMLEGEKGAAKECDLRCADATRYAELTARVESIRESLRGDETAEKIKAIEAQIAELKQAEFDVTQVWTFTKAEWSEQDYYLRLARHAYLEDPDSADKKAAFDQEQKQAHALEERAAAEGKVVEEAIDARKAAEAELAKAKQTEETKAIQKEIEALRRPYDEAKRAHEAAKRNKGGLMGAKTEVKQFDLPKINAVDRCTSCHMGTTRGGFEKVAEQEFRTHKFRRTIFGAHPPDFFGCTSCHDGQGSATTKFYAHAPSRDEDPHAFHTHFWERPVLKGPPGGDGTEYMEAKCRTCHEQQVELRSEILCEIDAECAPLSTEKKPIRCTLPNRQGQAAAQSSMATLPGTPPELLPEDERTQKMCTDRRGNPVLADLAPNYIAGVKIVEEAGCFGCHPIDGFKDMRKPAPNLTQVSKKVDPSWMVSWIENPKDHRPNTRMPNFFPEPLDPDVYPYPVDVDARMKKRTEEATAMAAFLLSTAASSEKYSYTLEKMPAGGDAARGKQLMGELGCAGCHDLPGDEARTPERKNRASHFDRGPDLRDMGAKTTSDWIYSWIRDPRAYNPDTRMPSLRLTEAEARDIATYLGTLEGDAKYDTVSRETLADEALIAEGKTLIKEYGCFGCHMVEGFEKTPGIGADLSAFGVKLPERLDFGDYITNHNQQTWNMWTINKLRHPRVYAYNAQAPVISYMPQYGLTEEEIRQVMVFLKSLRGDEDVSGRVLEHELSDQAQARERGRKMIRMYNCYGCHDVDDHDGELASLPELSGSNSIFGPPPLTAQGLKTQPAWLFGFLKQPFRMRPLPKVRMPTFDFTDDEVTDLVTMFSNFDGAEYPFTHYGDVGPRDAHEYAIGKALFDASGCQKCHVVGELGDGPVPAEVKAPNLLMGQQRLRPEWLALWLADPGVLQKNTAMPAFWLAGNQMEMFLGNSPEFRAALDGVPKDVIRTYAASPQLQIEATTNFLFRMGQPAPE